MPFLVAHFVTRSGLIPKDNTPLLELIVVGFLVLVRHFFCTSCFVADVLLILLWLPGRPFPLSYFWTIISINAHSLYKTGVEDRLRFPRWSQRCLPPFSPSPYGAILLSSSSPESLIFYCCRQKISPTPLPDSYFSIFYDLLLFFFFGKNGGTFPLTVMLFHPSFFSNEQIFLPP